MAETQMGIYRHYKGGFYQVSAPVAQDADSDVLFLRDAEGNMVPFRDRRVVVYTALYLKTGLRTSVRTEQWFHEQICTSHNRPFIECVLQPPKQPCRVIPRFEYLGQEPEEWMFDILTEEREREVTSG